jgi:TatD DNase family protein
MIDSHAHIYAGEFSADRDAMLEKCFDNGIGKIFMPNIDRTSVPGMLALEEKYPDQCYATMGLHPCYVNAEYETELAAVESWLQKRPFAAVGEIGLDYYWSVEFKTQQEEAFRIQVGWAKKYRLPIIIHCRNSFAETVNLLREIGTDGLTGVFHCFTGNLADARQVIEFGFLLGIGGIATFKNGGLDQVLPHIGMEHLLLETDSPYLAPVPHRGKRNQPAYLPLIAQRVADLKQTSIAEVDRITSENTLRLFTTKVRSEK